MKRIKDENENCILTYISLWNYAKFNELETFTGFSPAGLTGILKRLKDKKLIKKALIADKVCYVTC